MKKGSTRLDSYIPASHRVRFLAFTLQACILSTIFSFAISSQAQSTPAEKPLEGPARRFFSAENLLNRPWRVSVVYSFGYSLNRIEQPSHFELALSLPHGQKIEYGAYIGRSTAKVKDVVPFPGTGNVETRNYQLAAIGAGAKFLYRINETYSAFANLGFTRTTSDLKGVSTTAPVPPSLEPGPQEGEVWAPAYRLGGKYERFYRYGSVGATASYGSSSSNPEAEIQDLALGIFLKFYRRQQEN
jgi:hypothetical protein